MAEKVALLMIGAFVSALISIFLKTREKRHDSPCSDLREIKAKCEELQSHDKRLRQLENSSAAQVERDGWIKERLDELLKSINEIKKQITNLN